MLKLYGCLRSRATRPYWMLKEAGQSFEHVPVIQSYRLTDPAATDAPFNTASAGFLAVNPQGQIPAMEDDGLVLTESMAITVYIARKYGGDLGPRDLAEEGLALQWALVGATGIESPALEMLYTYVNREADSPEGQAKLAAATEALKRPFARIEGHLQGRDWLLGDRFTVADILLAECLRYAQPHAPALAPFPTIRAWLSRCQSRPAFKAMLEARNAEPA